MKISKRQIRRIIKEEKTKLLNEQIPSGQGQADLWYDAINELIYSELAASGGDIKVDGGAIVEALEDLRRTITDEMRGPTR